MRRFALCMVAVLSTGLFTANAQDDEPSDAPPGMLDRAGSRLREAMQRITVPRSRLTDGSYVRAAFRDVIAESSGATIRLKSDGRKVAVGGVVGSDGWIVSKASHLDGPITATLKDGREFPARIVGVDPAFDLAMLKIDATDLPVLNLARDVTPEVGQWVAVVGVGQDPLAVGVVSVGPREIPRQSGILGVLLGDAELGPRVDRVIPNSGAAQAGVLVNDIIIGVNNQPTKTRVALIQAIREFGPDDVVTLDILRDGEKQSIKATLTSRVESMGPDRGAMQNSFGSKLSKRRYGFPTALQHDAVIHPNDCGGPLVDLDGRTVGFNIARGGRTESYAIPTPVVVSRLYDLMSGNLAPRSEAELTSADEDVEAVANPTGMPPEPRS